MLTFLLYALLAWFLYNLVFKFIIPIYRTTRQIKKKFREMREQFDSQQSGSQQSGSRQSSQQNKSSKVPSGDYIDFEEVK